MNKIKKSLLAILATCLLVFAVAACGSDDSSSDSGSSSTGSSSQPSGSSGGSSSDAEPVANVSPVTGKTTAVKLDKGFVDALTKLKVTPAPVGKAEITKSGSAVFPITGGNVKYFKPGSVSPYVQGILEHEGSGLSLTAGDTEVELTDFVVDPGKSVLNGKVSVNGTVAAETAPLFSLDGSTLEPLKVKKSKNEAILQGATVKLTAEAADLLNKTFKIDALKEGLKIGVATITINAS